MTLHPWPSSPLAARGPLLAERSDVVATAANGEEQSALSRELDGRDDGEDVDAADAQPRPAVVDHPFQTFRACS
jgi:hypothetical protein